MILADAGRLPRLQVLKPVNSAGLRIFLWCFASFAIAWALHVLPTSLAASDLAGYANRIQNGDRFRFAALLPLRERLEAIETAPALQAQPARSAALIEVRLAELEVESGHAVGHNVQFERSNNVVRKALSLNPSDAFLWYALFWLDKTENGFRREAISYLEMSYEAGPNEGWVAVHRNGDALSVYTQLPPSLQKTVVREFRNLVAAGFIDDAANVLTGPGWSQRGALLAAIADLPDEQRRQLSERFTWRGIDLTVPGVSNKPRHPWDFAPG